MSRLLHTLEQLTALDLAATGYVNRWNQRRNWSRLFGAISRLGDGIFWYTLMIVLLLVYGAAAIQPVLHMLGIGILATLLYSALKKALSRPRPFVKDPHLCLSVAPLDKFSFPSGHTMHATSFTLLAVHYYPGLLWILGPFALAVAASRMILGLHYPSDVLAGATLGIGLATLSLNFIN